MATYNGQPITVGTKIADATVMRGGAPAAPASIAGLSEGESIAGLVLDDGERVELGRMDGSSVSCRVVAEPARERTRRGLAAALGRVQAATRAGEVAAPIDVQRLVLALVRETFGGES
jgi:hypothetical protein